MERTRPLLLIAMLSACRASPDRAAPPRAAAAVPSAPSARDDAGPSANAAIPDAAPVARPSASAPPWQPRVSAESFGGRWAALGADLVDASSGARVRKLPLGRPKFSADGEHLAVLSRVSLTVARASTPNDDFSAQLASDEDDASLLLADDGRSALVYAGDTLLVVDAAKKKATVLASIKKGDWDFYHRSRRMLTRDGRRVTWTVGSSAFARDLDLEKAITWTAGTKVATASAIVGDVAAGLFDDELVAVRVPSGEEIVRKRGVSDFVIGEEGRTIAWMDAQGAGMVVVLFDVAKKRETARAVLIDAPNVPPAKQRFRGVCGGGPFRLDALKDAYVTLERDCSLIDILRVRLNVPGSSTMESHTPAEQYEEDQRFDRACKRAKVADCASTTHFWASREKRVVIAEGGKLAVFDVASGRRIAVLEHSERLKDLTNVAVAPNGNTMAGVDDNDTIRLWDLATGKPLFESKP